MPLHRSATLPLQQCPKRRWWVQSLGVDEPLNYKEADLEKLFSDQQFDFIFDSIGGECWQQLLLRSG